MNNIRIHIFIPGSRSFIGSFHSTTRPHRLATCHIPNLVGAVMIGGVSHDQAFRSCRHLHKQCAIVEVSYDQLGFPFEAKSGKNSSERISVHYRKLFQKWNMKIDKLCCYQMRKWRDSLEQDQVPFTGHISICQNETSRHFLNALLSEIHTSLLKPTIASRHIYS